MNFIVMIILIAIAVGIFRMFLNIINKKTNFSKVVRIILASLCTITGIIIIGSIGALILFKLPPPANRILGVAFLVGICVFAFKAFD